MNNSSTKNQYSCCDCPRTCGALRSETRGFGYCGSASLPAVARAAAHFGEEPCISGTKGSGTVFFSGCNLKCVFCQNREISLKNSGKTISVNRLREIFTELRDKGVHNINLVTPSHFTRAISEALESLSLGIPVVYNSSGYDGVSSLRMLDGKISVYMPDYKYAFPALAEKYSGAADYPDIAKNAILEMYRQTGPFVTGKDGLLLSGVLIRHLILPGQLENTFEVIDWVSESFPAGAVMFSLMSQYTPMGESPAFPELSRTITAEEHETAVDYLMNSRIENGFYQDLCSATDELIPAFDYTGI
jgi:putative pyruvate formate lyase activating enzyme